MADSKAVVVSKNESKKKEVDGSTKRGRTYAQALTTRADIYTFILLRTENEATLIGEFLTKRERMNFIFVIRLEKLANKRRLMEIVAKTQTFLGKGFGDSKINEKKKECLNETPKTLACNEVTFAFKFNDADLKGKECKCNKLTRSQRNTKKPHYKNFADDRKLKLQEQPKIDPHLNGKFWSEGDFDAEVESLSPFDSPYVYYGDYVSNHQRERLSPSYDYDDYHYGNPWISSHSFSDDDYSPF